tara:strand:- start:9235 stop:9423 length:189 start_codon:yes stop_codon:yes gene_type:complete
MVIFCNIPVVIPALKIVTIQQTYNWKTALKYQNRPIFETHSNGDITNAPRKGMFTLQFQIAI